MQGPCAHLRGRFKQHEEDVIAQGQAGLGHYESVDVYDTYRNGRCYALSLDMESYRTEGSSGDASFIQRELDSILNSFSFTQ